MVARENATVSRSDRTRTVLEAARRAWMLSSLLTESKALKEKMTKRYAAPGSDNTVVSTSE